MRQYLKANCLWEVTLPQDFYFAQASAKTRPFFIKNKAKS